ncbi:MAG: HEAT repeat domain-containing protein [Gemmatimonadaceae bacterium]|jgi:HEAT repeat protein
MQKLVPVLSLVAAAIGGAALPAPAVASAAPIPQATTVTRDSGEALYRRARAALSEGEYDRAAELFAQMRASYPKSAYAGDTYYWEAFVLSRDGSNARLRRAVSLLDAQAKEYPSAVTVTSGDARTLATRLKGVLARGGDADAAADVVERAARAERSAVRAASAGRRTTDTPPGCKDEEDDDRIEALNALMQMNAEQAMPILKKVLERRDQCSELLRRKAVFLIAQKRTEESADILLKAAKTDPDNETRSQAIFWLSQVSGDKAEEFLLGLIRDSKDAEVQERALFSLSQRKSERAQQAMRDFATRTDVSPQLRERAIFWLGQRRTEENAKFLRDAFAKSDNDEVRERILFSLAQMKGMGNDTFILDQAANPKLSIGLRKQALFWASQQGMVSTAQLASIYDKNTDSEMREQVVFVLAQRGNKDGSAVDKLLEIAKTEKNADLRKRAIFWLGQSKDPRAAKLLQELIER